MARSSNFPTTNQYIVYWIEMIQNSQSISGNYSNGGTVWCKRTNTGYTTYGNGTCYCTIAGTAYSAGITNSQTITSTPRVLFSKRLNIYHNTDGKKSIYISARIVHDRFSSSTHGATFGLTTIPRASTPTLSAGTTTMGNAVTIYTNRASSSFTHTLRYAYGSASGTIATGVGTSRAWTIPLSLANQIPNSTSGWGYIYCDTYSGSTKIGTKSVKFTAVVPSSIVPTFTAITHSEYVSDVATIVGKYVQGLSRLSLAITGAAGSYSSTIKSYSIVFDGVNYSSSSAISGVIKNSGDLTITGKVTDSRGRTCTKSITVNVLPYSAPKITAFTLQRCGADGITDEMGEYVKVTRAGSVSSLVNVSEKNSLTYRIKTKARGATTWETKKEILITGISLSGTDIIGTYSATISYDFRLEITDKFNTTVSLNILPTGTPVLSWDKVGVGIGKIREQGVLDVGGDIYKNNHKIGGIMAGSFDFDADSAVELGAYHMGEQMGQPGIGTGQLLTIGQGAGSAGSSVSQIYIRDIEDEMYFRRKTGETWGDWIQANEIVESGENSNGRYVRFSDGTQICWLVKTYQNIAVTSAYGPIYRQSDNISWQHPASYIEIPSFVVQSNYHASMAYCNAVSLSQAQFKFAHVVSTTTSPTAYLLSIGKWK